MANPLLQHYIKLTEFLGQALGPDYEVALHDMTDKNRSIVAIANNHISGREIGAPLTNVALKILMDKSYETQDYRLHYCGLSAEGKTLDFVKAAAGEQVLWEPGCTYTLPELRVVNNGNLALKYKLVISGIRGDAELNNVIDWAVTLDGAAYTLGEEHHLAAKNGETVDADVLTISGKMQGERRQ